MIKNQKTVRELIQRHQENSARIEEIANLCEQEKRERTESESAEYAKLVRDNDMISMKLQALQSPELPVSVDRNQQLRDALSQGKKVQFVLTRDVTLMKTTDLEGTGIIPIDQQEMLKPLREGLIWNKVGLTIRTGLKGKLRWPKHAKAVAKFVNEGDRLEDSKIDFSKLEMSGERLGVAIPVTREELEDSDGIVESVINEEMPAAIIDVINEALFTTEKGSRKVYGPFAEEDVQTVEFAGDVPTRAELLEMKATVAKTGIQLANACWVMTESTKAQLEDAKVDAGRGRFICENNTILGYPVFTTSAIGEGNVGFGDWGYQAAGFFGDWNMIVDPYTLARNNATDFVLNTRFGTTTLYKEAFVLGKVGE